jgi:hypothetical protein
MLVQRHRYDAERVRDLAHAECVDTAFIGQRDGGAQDPLLVQRCTRLRDDLRGDGPSLSSAASFP